jgi:hypothetical protein
MFADLGGGTRIYADFFLRRFLSTETQAYVWCAACDLQPDEVRLAETRAHQESERQDSLVAL